MEFPLSWWWIFFRPPRNHYEYRPNLEPTERSQQQVISVQEVREKPVQAASSPAPMAMATPQMAEAKTTPATPASATSVTPDKSSTDKSKKIQDSPKNQPSEKQQKKSKPDKGYQASHQPQSQKKAKTKEQLSIKRHSDAKPDAPKSSPGVAQSEERSTGSKRVHFAMGVKQGDDNTNGSYPSPGSSDDSWVDPPPTDMSTDARDCKPSLKGAYDASPTLSASDCKLLEILSFEDVWSDGSDDEGSAIDISDVPTIATSDIQPTLRGILKTHGGNGRVQAKSTNRTQQQGTRSRTRQANREPLAFTSRNLERAKRSGFDPVTVRAIGREDGYRSPYEGRERGHRRPKVRADDEDHRVEMALEQARSNGHMNKHRPTIGSSDHHPNSHRPALGSLRNPRGEQLGPTGSNRLPPVFVFRPSDSKENDPGIIVHTQAELDAARKDYFRRRNRSS